MSKAARYLSDSPKKAENGWEKLFLPGKPAKIVFHQPVQTLNQPVQIHFPFPTPNLQLPKPMAKADLIHKGDLVFGAQMRTFKNNIGPVAASLGMTPEQVAAQAADADYYNYVLACHAQMLAHAKGWTALKKNTRIGRMTGVLSSLEAPVLPTPVPPVPPGVERRFRALLRQLKAGPNYTFSLGEGLGIEAVNHSPPDYTTLQPVLKLSISGNRVLVGWGWQGHRVFLDQCEIWVDRGDGRGFVLLTYTITPGYTDLTPFPAAPVKWLYRAIYRLNDESIGQWSKTASVTVPA